MPLRIGINGFGRIGRTLFRAARKDPLFRELQIVAINDPTPVATLAHLLRYDSVAGRLESPVEVTPHGLRVEGHEVTVSAEQEPARIPWERAGVAYVVEATGHFTSLDACMGHLQPGVRRVVITAPAKGEVKNFVMGVNEHEFDPERHRVVSNASCTTNCLAPVAKVILERFGLVRGLMTTIHAYTNDQRLLDFPHADLRRARAAGLSMIPTHTGAAAAIGLVLPQLQGRFDGLSVRVPTPNVSLVDAVMEVERTTTPDEVNAALKSASNRFLGFSDEPLVSVDYLGDPRSSVVDGPSTRVIGSMVKVMSWYDNEWGYSNRVLDLLLHMAGQEI